jgi:hypothetical protein
MVGGDTQALDRQIDFLQIIVSAGQPSLITGHAEVLPVTEY